MATVLYGALVDAVRGSINGLTFSAGGGVEVVKGKARGRRPIRTLQLPAKSQMQRVSPLWRGLTQSDRDDWDTYAATVTLVNSLGQNYQLSGLSMFIRNSMFMALRGIEGAAVIPTANGLPSVPTAVFTWTDPDVIFTSTTPALAAGEEIRGTLFVPSPSSRSQPRGYVFGTFSVGNGDLPVTIGADYRDGYSASLALRAWVSWRFIDADFRLSQSVQSMIEVN